MWNPNENAPVDFLDVLYGEEEDEEDIDTEGEIEEIPQEEEEEVAIVDMPVFLEGPGGIMQPIGPDGHPVLEDPVLESSDEEWERAHRVVQEAVSPLSSPARPADPVRPADPDRPADLHQILPEEDLAFWGGANIAAAGSGRGRPSTRGRGRGAGRRRGGARFNERRWVRGSDLEEMYVRDSDLPLHIQEQIRTHLAGVNARRRIIEEENEEDERYYDANEQFVWTGMEEWQGERSAFVPESTGPTVPFESEYEAMHAIWTDDIMAHIAGESNRYAESVLGQRRPRFMRDWFPTNLHEIWTLFAFWLMLGIIRMPSIKSCFAKIPLLKTDVFRALFTEGRYWDVNAAFHLAEGTDPNNPLHPMGPIIDHLNMKFQELYRLDQEICIDESLTLWKGPVGFQQYIKTKAARFGIKTYELCESTTGYLWSFFVYVGRATATGNLPSSVSSVLRLVQPLLNLGYTLFMDNWFNSPSLARWLKRKNTDCVGTLRPSRKGVPDAIKLAPLQEGQFVARTSGDVMVVALQDRKRVTCISTYHDISQSSTIARPGHPAQFKLNLIRDYNKAMGGVDRMDSMLEAYLVERKQCKKWNKKLFKRLLNISIQNARIIVEKSTGTKIDSLAFRLRLVEQIINNHLQHVPRRPTSAQHRRNPTFPLQRLTERHFIRRIPITDEVRAAVSHRSNQGRRYCVWCSHQNRRSKTVYECEECGLALCLEPCFKEFHTMPE